MADEITAFIMTFAVGLAIIGPAILLLAFYKKLPLPLWKKYRLMVYALPDGIEYDPALTPIQQIHKNHGTMRKEFSFWKYGEKGIIKYWVRRQFVMGFFLDYMYMPCIRNFDGKATLRLLEKKRDVWDTHNFIPLDLPEGMRHDKFQADLSAAAEEVHNAVRHEMQRGQMSDIWKDIVIPAIGILAAIVIIYFAQLHSESMAKIYSQAYGADAQALQLAVKSNYYATCAQIKRQYGIECADLEPKTNATAAQPAKSAIPFTGG